MIFYREKAKGEREEVTDQGKKVEEGWKSRTKKRKGVQEKVKE